MSIKYTDVHVHVEVCESHEFKNNFLKYCQHRNIHRSAHFWTSVGCPARLATKISPIIYPYICPLNYLCCDSLI